MAAYTHESGTLNVLVEAGNDKGRFKDTVAGILNPKDFLDTP